LDTIRKSKLNILFTYANADESGYIINNEIEKFVIEDPEKYKVIKSLGQKRYLSAMKYVDVLIGNTSSGIIEAASFGKPVVNIGDRQKGRLRNTNIIDCSIETLKESIDRALDDDFLKISSSSINLYGSGNASAEIVENLEKIELKIKKRFYDYD
jgi:UDP-N-acetylglucosamine 2-epimerase